MNKRLIVALLFLILLSTITVNQKLFITNFNLKEIKIENNQMLGNKEIKKLLLSIYGKNLLFLNYKEVERALMVSSLIDSLK